MSFHSSIQIRKTRKRRPCQWCGESIDAGAAAWKHSGVWDGDFYHGYTHPECETAMLSKEGRDATEDGYMPGEFKRGTAEEK